ncbi:MAG: sterol desaturase family protein [Oligoflexus sp.]|nr:sterol desaturase family protein [Pseudopedobacter sp.]
MNLNNAASIQLLFFAFTIVILWHWELFFNGEFFKKKWKHTQLNIGFMLTAAAVQLPLTVFLIKVMQWTSIHHWGIIYLIPYSSHFLIKMIVGIILLDFFEYLYHVTMHKTSYLWDFHLVHHSDTKLDVSTTVREHPVETFVRVSMMILVVYITGVPLIVLVIRQFIQTFFNITSHTSNSLPSKIEKFLSFIFITPDLHKAHHHHQLPYTDCNYGDILCIWDRLFGTYAKLDTKEIVFGLDTVNQDQIKDFNSLLNVPFNIKTKSTLVSNKNIETSIQPII